MSGADRLAKAEYTLGLHLDVHDDALILTAVYEDRHWTGVTYGDLRALVTALRGVLAVHYPADDDAQRTPVCPECHGKAGTHPCGCWAPEDRAPVCGACNKGHKGASVPYPCATVRAIEEALA